MDIKVFKNVNYCIVVTIPAEFLSVMSVEDKIDVLGMYLGPSWGYDKGPNRSLSHYISGKQSKSKVDKYVAQLKLTLEKAKSLYAERLIEHIVIEDITMKTLGPLGVIKTRLIDDYR